MLVPILIGSESDQSHADKIISVLNELEIPSKLFIASAHKVPEKVMEIINEYNKSDEAVCYITIAGRSNALSGMVAANSIHPVIACPPFKDKEDYELNINSSLQMPSETPVMVIIDPKNAALAAGKIFALNDKRLAEKISNRIKQIKNKF